MRSTVPSCAAVHARVRTHVRARPRVALGAACAMFIALSSGGCGGASGAGTTTPEDDAERACTAALRFEDPAEGQPPEDQPPRTVVSLVLICEEEPVQRATLGSEVGACYPIESQGVLLRARCWWGGEGSVIEVRRQDDVLVVERSGIDEHTGTGPPSEVSRMDVPEGAHVEAL
jgi:hypothetical protein